jgi:hypothetical protein
MKQQISYARDASGSLSLAVLVLLRVVLSLPYKNSFENEKKKCHAIAILYSVDKRERVYRNSSEDYYYSKKKKRKILLAPYSRAMIPPQNNYVVKIYRFSTIYNFKFLSCIIYFMFYVLLLFNNSSSKSEELFEISNSPHDGMKAKLST